MATPGHIKSIQESNAKPIFAQQSIRELNLTNRTMEDVIDCAAFSVFQEPKLISREISNSSFKWSPSAPYPRI